MRIDGTWRVKVTSGPLWFRALNLIRDKKIIKGNSGYNVASGFTWGIFTVEYLNTEIVLTYTDQPIIDRARFVGKDELSGKFYWRNDYIGNFKMERKII